MKVAVQIRAHQVTDKLLDLIDQLKGSTRYDLFLSYDVKDGPVHLDGAATLPYTRQTFIDLGLPVESDKADNVVMWTHCDYTLYAAMRAQPDYDYFISIEFDVAFLPRGPGFIHTIIDRLEAEQARPIDLIVAQLGPTDPVSYGLHGPAAALYPKVFGCLCPVAVFSRSALDHLYEQKLIEASRDMHADGYVHWEAFVATALLDAKTFRCEQFETLFPGCVERDTYRPGLPMLLGHPPPLPEAVRMIHPVLAGREYGLRHIYFANIENRLEQFVDLLTTGEGSFIAEEYRAPLLKQALSNLRTRNPTTRQLVGHWLMKVPGVTKAWRTLRGRADS